jgi:hypothetical protein
MVIQNLQQISDSTSLVVWGQNLALTVKERFSRTELAMVRLPVNVYSFIIGLLLSDGWLHFASSTNKNIRLGFLQSSAHCEYVWFVFSLLSYVN